MPARRVVGGVKDRLWRARRQHDHIDAVLRRRGVRWDLQFLHNDRILLTRRYAQRDLACEEAAARLRDLQRAGWTAHW